MFLDRHGPTIFSTVVVPAFAGTGRTLAITPPVPVPVAVSIDGNATGTDPYIGLGQRNRIARRHGPPGEGGEGRQAECRRKQYGANVHEILQNKLLQNLPSTQWSESRLIYINARAQVDVQPTHWRERLELADGGDPGRVLDHSGASDLLIMTQFEPQSSAMTNRILIELDQCQRIRWRLRNYMRHLIASINSVPVGRRLHLAVVDEDGLHALVFPCRRTEDCWIHAETEAKVDVHPTHWREWSGQ